MKIETLLNFGVLAAPDASVDFAQAVGAKVVVLNRSGERASGHHLRLTRPRHTRRSWTSPHAPVFHLEPAVRPSFHLVAHPSA